MNDKGIRDRINYLDVCYSNTQKRLKEYTYVKLGVDCRYR